MATISIKIIFRGQRDLFNLFLRGKKKKDKLMFQIKYFPKMSLSITFLASIFV